MDILIEGTLVFLEKVPRMVYGWFARYLLRKVKDQVVCRNTKLELGMGYEAAPMLNFLCLVDNKTPLALTAEQITLTFYMASSIVGSVAWSRPELDIPFHETLPLPTNKVEDIKPKGAARVNLWYPLQLGYLKSDYMNGWNVKGIAVFNSKIGNFHVPISDNFSIEAEQIKQARNKYKAD